MAAASNHLATPTRSSRFAFDPARQGLLSAPNPQVPLTAVTAAASAEDPCVAPGVTVLTDPAGDQLGAPVANSELDIRSVSIAELGTDSDALTFRLVVSDLSTVPPNGIWEIRFTAPDQKIYFVDMESDPTSAVTYNYGTYDPSTGIETPKGPADYGTLNRSGSITIRIANSKVGSAKASDVLSNIKGVTYILVGAFGSGGTKIIDDTSNATPTSASYTLVGNSACGDGTPTPTPTPQPPMQVPPCGLAWRIVPSPNVDAPTGPGHGALNRIKDIAAVSANDVWVVGYARGGAAPSGHGSWQTMTEHWDGNTWTIVPSPNPIPVAPTGQYTPVLTAVAAVSADDVWAVGYNFGEDIGVTGNKSLIEHWNGSQWNIVPSPNQSGSLDDVLFDVAAVSKDDVWAVGFYDHFALIEHWDGSSWTIVPGAGTGDFPAGTTLVTLNAVAAISANDVWAVGSYNTGVYPNATTKTLTEHWDGSKWSVVPCPTKGNYAELQIVSARAANDVWASGGGAFILHWDGSAWSLVPYATNPPTSISGILAVSADDVWGVGSRYGSYYLESSASHWGGNGWSAVLIPSRVDVLPWYPYRGENYLYSITKISPNDIWAAGLYSIYDNDQDYDYTLIEHYSDPCAAAGPVPLASVVSRKVHGTAGTFDIDVSPNGRSAVECRTGGANGDYQMVLTFANAVTVNGTPQAQVTSGTGQVGTGGTSNGGVVSVNGAVVTVPLTNVANAQKITLTLFNVSDGTNTGDVSVPIGILLGDTTADSFVNSADISQTKSQSGQVVTNTNFREDVTTDGNLNSADISLVKSKSGTALP